MDRKIVKKEMLPFVRSYLDTKGFKMNNGSDNIMDFGFETKTSFGGIEFSFHFNHSGLSSNTLFHLSLNVVEDIMLKVELPNISLVTLNERGRLLHTVKDLDPAYKYLASPYYMNQGITTNKNLILTKADIEDWKECFVDYFENAGEDFTNRYCFLPNVLEKIDEISDSGKKSFTEFICGRLDQLFRVLIISKLCGDDRFEEKKEYADSIILRESRKEYHPHYSLLKEELEKLDPVFFFN